MRTYAFPLATVLALGIACSSFAAQRRGSTQGSRNQPKKIWTNDDIDQLRARSPISIVGREPGEARQQGPGTPQSAQPAFPVYESRLDDPTWYANQAAELQAELDRRMADVQQQLEAMTVVKDRVTEAGIAMDKPSVGVSPAAALATLQGRVQEIQDQLGDLAELARQHGIPAGVLRG